MLSDAEGKRQRRALLREIAAEHKRKDREKLRQLRAHIRNVKVRRREAMRRVKLLCRRGRQNAKIRARARAHEIRAQAKLAITQERAEQKRRACTSCKAKKQAVKSAALSATHRRRQLLHAERELQREIKRIEGWAKKRKREQKRTTAREARQESDEAVRQNIPGELLQLWERVKGSIRGSTRHSRTEEFLKYAEENPNEVVDAAEQLAQREIARLIREEKALSRAMRSARRYKPTAEELAAIPF